MVVVAFGAFDDSGSIKKEEVETIVRELSVSYSHIRRSFQESIHRIDAYLDAGDVTSAIQLFARTYSLPRGYVKRVGYSAKIDSPAALIFQFDLLKHRVVKCTVYFQDSKTDLLKLPRYRFLHMVAHELAHARMALDLHSLRLSEFATDVLAVLTTGNSREYTKTMFADHIQYGYIRADILDELFRCLNLYAERIYIK